MLDSIHSVYSLLPKLNVPRIFYHQVQAKFIDMPVFNHQENIDIKLPRILFPLQTELSKANVLTSIFWQSFATHWEKWIGHLSVYYSIYKIKPTKGKRDDIIEFVIVQRSDKGDKV